MSKPSVNVSVLNMAAGLGVTVLSKSISTARGTFGVGEVVGVSETDLVGVILGVRVIVGVNEIVGVNVIVGVKVGVVVGGKKE